MNELWLCDQQTGEIEKLVFVNGRAESRTGIIVEIVGDVITFRNKWATGITLERVQIYGPPELDNFTSGEILYK